MSDHDSTSPVLRGRAKPFRRWPVPGADLRERRIHARAYDYWRMLRLGNEFPDVADFDPLLLDDRGMQSFLIDFSQSLNRPIVRLIGPTLRDECGLKSDTVAVADVPPGSLLGQIVAQFADVLANRAPVSVEAEFITLRRTKAAYRGVLLPLSSNGVYLDFMYGVISWRETEITVN